MRRLTLLLLIGVFGLLSLGGTTVKRGPQTTMTNVTGSPRYASWYRDNAVAMTANAGLGTYGQFLTAGAAFVEVTDNTTSFAFGAACDGFTFTGSNGTFEVTANLKILTTGSVQDTIDIAFGVDGTASATTFTGAGFSVAGTVHSQNSPISLTDTLDLVSGNCVDLHASCSVNADCDPSIAAGSVVIKELSGTDGTTAGTANVSVVTSSPYSVTATDIENGVLLVECGGAASASTCEVNITPLVMSAGKALTIISNSPNSDADIIRIDPAVTQMIETTDTLGDRLDSSGVYQEKITLFGMDTDSIAILGKTGTWLDAN